MAAVTTGTTFTQANYIGELFHLTPTQTPFTAMAGGLAGAKVVHSKEHTWQTDDGAAAAQTAALEGDAPSYTERTRTEVKNVLQIFQYGWQTSYTKDAAWDQLGDGAGTPSLAATAIVGTQPVMSESARQALLMVQRAARDYEYSALQGTFAHPNDNATARKMRGIVTATTTNAVAAGSVALAKSHIDTLLKTMVDAGAPLTNPVVFVNSFQKLGFSNVYGFAPDSRNVGGVNINQVETDFAVLGIVYARHLPADTVLVADMAYVQPVVMPIPGKGYLFTEPLGKIGASTQMQLYGELGLEYGPEKWHGKITGLTTS